MAELIQVRGITPAIHFAIAAITNSNDVPDRGDGFLEIAFTVNGVELPFEKTIEQVYRQMEQNINQLAAEYALSQARLEGLADLQQAVRDCDWQLRQKIQEVFDVELEERD